MRLAGDPGGDPAQQPAAGSGHPRVEPGSSSMQQAGGRKQEAAPSTGTLTWKKLRVLKSEEVVAGGLQSEARYIQAMAWSDDLFWLADGSYYDSSLKVCVCNCAHARARAHEWPVSGLWLSSV